jgi:hypothetical protein
MKAVMADVPTQMCIHCLPHCETTIFKIRISAAPIRKCELNNFRSNFYCNPSGTGTGAGRFESGTGTGTGNVTGTRTGRFGSEYLSDMVLSYYQKQYSTHPYFCKTTSLRKYGSLLPTGDVFETTNKPYFALEKDIASVQIFFESPHATQIIRSSEMSWTDFFSSVGGIFGLVLGVGIISLLEVLWLTVQYRRAMFLKIRNCKLFFYKYSWRCLM